MHNETLLEIDGLSVSFRDDDGALAALKDVSFDISAGKTVCLVGESGCGKSLTARSLLRILDPNADIAGGSMRFRGRDGAVTDLAAERPKSEPMRRIRGNEITMIFQEPMTALSVFHTIGDQIIEAVRVHERISKKAARARALEALEAVGMPDAAARLDAYTFELSGGQRQRAMIAMALVTNPRLLIADEPTTALDVTTQAVILELLQGLKTRFGMSILFITHDLGVVAEMADEVVVMYLGEVVERGPVERIFSAPRHPYTRALLSAAPHYSTARDARLPVIPGTVPSLAKRPDGCAFATRCAFAEAGCCDAARPPMMEGETDARCFFAGDERLKVPISAEAEAPSATSSPGAQGRRPVILQADRLSRRFERKRGLFRSGQRVTRAVSEVSLALAEGETLGLVGESGCGKSTLGNMLAALLDPSEGQVSLGINGESRVISGLGERDRRAVWRDLRVVFQDPYSSLNPRMSVFDIVAEPLRAGPGRAMKPDALKARVEDVLSRVGLDPSLAGRYPHAFSGGQRQRIGIARALAPSPRIIIADEPASALDVSVQAQILNLFRDLQTSLGLTYLFISHDLNVVSNIANRVAVMYAGRIIEMAETADIYHRPRHPYSAALLNAVLTPEYHPTKPERKRLTGAPPNPALLPEGCAFSPRCPFATDLCRREAPPLQPDGKGRLTACHRRDELQLDGLGVI